MNLPLSNEKLHHAAALYEDSLVPTIILDAQLHVYQLNKAAATAFAGLTSGNSIISLLSKEETAEMIEALSRGKVVQHTLNAFPFSGASLSVTPLFQETEMIGSVVHLSTAGAETPFSPQGSSRIIWAFNNQIRQPLTSIFTSLSGISQNFQYEENDRYASYLSNINQNCYQILRCSMSITEYSKYASGLNQLQAEKLDLTNFLEATCSTLKLLTEPLQIPFTYSLPKEPVYVKGDKNKIEIALFHLFSNSCHFTKEGNQISLNLTVTGKQAVIQLSDRGCGIDEDILPYVFDPYFSYTDEGMPFGGTGLGLTLVKLIATQHGGTVAIQSTPMEGTTVGFTLPLDNSAEDTLIFRSTTSSDYILNRFSNIYVILSDVSKCPLP